MNNIKQIKNTDSNIIINSVILKRTDNIENVFTDYDLNTNLNISGSITLSSNLEFQPSIQFGNNTGLFNNENKSLGIVLDSVKKLDVTTDEIIVNSSLNSKQYYIAVFYSTDDTTFGKTTKRYADKAYNSLVDTTEISYSVIKYNIADIYTQLSAEFIQISDNKERFKILMNGLYFIQWDVFINNSIDNERHDVESELSTFSVYLFWNQFQVYWIESYITIYTPDGRKIVEIERTIMRSVHNLMKTRYCILELTAGQEISFNVSSNRQTLQFIPYNTNIRSEQNGIKPTFTICKI